MKPGILVTRQLPDAVMELLGENFDLRCNPYDRVLTRGELIQSVKDKEGILPLLTDRIDAEVMDEAAPELKIIANYAVGLTRNWKKRCALSMRIRSYSLKPRTLSLSTSPSPVKPGISLDIKNCA